METSIELSLAPVSSSLVLDIQELAQREFGAYQNEEGDWRFRNMPDFTVVAARKSGQLVGFKLGYARTPTRYYSWLGAVDAQHRRQGIARALMRKQHNWLAENGYLKVETSARQSNHEMARLNLASGFKVVGIRYKGGDPDILYEKEIVVHSEITSAS